MEDFREMMCAPNSPEGHLTGEGVVSRRRRRACLRKQASTLKRSPCGRGLERDVEQAPVVPTPSGARVSGQHALARARARVLAPKAAGESWGVQ